MSSLTTPAPGTTSTQSATPPPGTTLTPAPTPSPAAPLSTPQSPSTLKLLDPDVNPKRGRYPQWLRNVKKQLTQLHPCYWNVQKE